MSLGRPPAEWLSRNTGRNFVFIHGLAMSPTFWRLYAPGCVRERNAVAYPLPGHHPWPLASAGAQLTTDQIVEAYAKAIEEDFPFGRVTLVGHSTGGFVSLLLAAARPDLIQSVVLMGSFACGRFEGRERVAARILRIPGLGPRFFAACFRRWISSQQHFRHGSIECVYDKTCPWETEEARAMMEEVRIQLQRSRPEDIASVVAWFQRTSALPVLPELQVPALNIIGANDSIVPPSHQIRISRMLPNAQTVLFGNSGHLLMVERQSEFNKVLERFIEAPILVRSPLSARGRVLAHAQPQKASINPVESRRRWSVLANVSRRIPHLVLGTNQPHQH
ncbi:alpha/beta fold hydrolase [Agrobacterium sp. ES01]|uniref:alpha/beta fold hydrolase n=1 Tax=Agrobacterium sp. ES01 TaxID=3420714 RepID=UPI003D0D104E